MPYADPEVARAFAADYRASHRHDANDYARAYRAKNADRLRAERRAYYLAHRAERIEAAVAWRRAHPEGREVGRSSERFRRYGLTVEQYDALLEAQGFCCAICGEPETTSNAYGSRSLAVDHDHEHCAKGCPACVRGLLCRRCNLLLGYANDDDGTLQAAIAYLCVPRGAG
jgi:Recombination endonuclease VII